MTLKQPITFITTQSPFEQLCIELQKEAVIALDVETSLYLEPPKLSLIQVSNKGQNWIIDPLSPKIIDLTPFKSVLENPEVVKIIHNASFEKKVFKVFGYEIINVYDTLSASRKIRGRKLAGGHSLKQVALRELNIEMDKGEQVSNWQKRPLTESQINYAALDSEVLIYLYDIFNPPEKKPPLNFEEPVLQPELKEQHEHQEQETTTLDELDRLQRQMQQLLVALRENQDGDIKELYYKIQLKLHLLPNNRLTNPLIQILDGLKEIVIGFSNLSEITRHKKLSPHHKALLKGAATTLIEFLNGTFHYQKEKGSL